MAKPYKSVLTRHQLKQLAGLFRHQVEAWLDGRLDDYFSRVEEALHTQAGQAPSDADEQGFLEAASRLREGRSELAIAFRNHLLKAVETFFLHYEAYLEEFIHGFTAASGRSLELVNNEKLEEDLVILRTAHRATTRLQASHKELVSYMAAVVQPKDLPQNGTPLSPQVMANCMRMALAGWEGTLASRFVFYQVLADRLLQDIDEFYPRLVELLRKAGLEPVPVKVRMKAPAMRPRLQPPAPERGTAAGEGSGGRAESEETALFSVISLMRQLGEEDREVLGMVGSMAGLASGGGAAMKPEQIVRILQELQEQVPDPISCPEVKALASHRREWKQGLVRRLREEMEARQLRLHALDQQILDIVTMLFDFVLDDSLIPDAMKVLLVRLQIPVLQIAVRDKTFLTNTRHPARVLINNLSRAAVRWADTGDCSDDNVYGMIRASVERILAGDARDPELYAEVNREFMEFLAQEERGARVAEERVSQVARGREQLAMARRRVAEILDSLVTDDLPEVVRQILEDAWRDVLTLILLREGEESDAWRDALSVARRLAHSVWGLEIPKQRARFLEEVPHLLGELRRGFASISYDSKKAAQLLERLEACHRAASSGGGEMAASCTRRSPPAPAAVGETAVAEPDYYETLVGSLREGDWVRWELPGEGEQRGKLAWRSEIADILLFVDMRGRKLAEHSSRELAALFRRGQASRLENIDRPFMERAFRYLHGLLNRRVGRNLPRILPA